MTQHVCNQCGAGVFPQTIATNVPGSVATAIYICPHCDRVKCPRCDLIDLSGTRRRCANCNRPLGIHADPRLPD